MTARHRWTKAERAEIGSRSDGRCVDCGDVDGPHEIEHDIPLWLGGTDTVDNAVLRCVACHKPKTKAEAKQRAKIGRLARQTKGLPKRSKLSKKVDGTILDQRTGGLPWETRDGFSPVTLRSKPRS